jgi:hypothetical protein
MIGRNETKKLIMFMVIVILITTACSSGMDSVTFPTKETSVISAIMTSDDQGNVQLPGLYGSNIAINLEDRSGHKVVNAQVASVADESGILVLIIPSEDLGLSSTISTPNVSFLGLYLTTTDKPLELSDLTGMVNVEFGYETIFLQDPPFSMAGGIVVDIQTGKALLDDHIYAQFYGLETACCIDERSRSDNLSIFFTKEFSGGSILLDEEIFPNLVHLETRQGDTGCFPEQTKVVDHTFVTKPVMLTRFALDSST